MRKPFQSPDRMKNSSYYIAPAGDRTHDLPHTVALNMVKVSYAPNHSATDRRNTKIFHTNMLRKYVSRAKSEDNRMKDDVVQGLQLVSEDQDSQCGSEYTMFCPFEATEAWTDGSICPQLTAVQQLLETIRLLEEYGDVCIL